MLHVLLLSLLPAQPFVQASPVAPTVAAEDTHGKLPWFRGTWAELLAEAKKTNKPIFIDFWTTWCGWCKRLDKDTFSDATVVEAMKDVLCYSVDAEQSDPKADMDGVRLAQRFAARGYPYLVFTDASGELTDRISGYLPPADFLRETTRILSAENTLGELRARVALEPANVFLRGDYMQRLGVYGFVDAARSEGAELRMRIQRGEGFDLASMYERWRASDLLRRSGDEAGANAQLDAIRQFGERGVQWLARRAALDTTIGVVNQAYQREKRLDSTPFVAYLEQEKLPELLYEGWTARRNLELFTASERRNQQRPEDAQKARLAARAAAAEIWKYAPERFRGDAARELVTTWLGDAAELGEGEKKLLVDVATWATGRFPTDAARHDLLGRALAALGHHDRAVSAFERALELAPSRLATRKRLEDARKQIGKQ